MMAVALSCGTGCARSPADKLIDRAIEQLEVAEGLLAESERDPIKLRLAVMHYRNDNRVELRTLRSDAEALVSGLDASERKKLADDSRLKTAALMNRIHKLTLTYPEPKHARHAIQSLVFQAGQAAPTEPRKVRRPWMPPVPPLPVDDEAPAATPGAVTPTP